MSSTNPIKSFEPAKGVSPDKFFDRIKAKHVIALVGAAALLIVSMGISSVSYRLHKEGVDALDNHARVEENSELTYYLTVKEDGVDVSGTQSSDMVTANIQGGLTTVTDRLPDGLEFVGFTTTSDGTIGAASRSDAAVPCGGHVIDDTEEESVSEGTWNADHTEYTYHGLHYDAATRTVSFKAENIQAGCGLTVGIVTRTPTLASSSVRRMDFYNTAKLTQGIFHINSNTMHVWLGRNNVATYDVVYQYTGDVPSHAPTVPETQSYAAGTTVFTELMPQVEGYQFSGWQTSDVAVSSGTFTMPEDTVTLTGSFVANPTSTKYSVSYVIDGDTPKNYVLPKTKQYEAGTLVTLDSAKKGSMTDDFTFNGWTSEDIELDETGFVMPARDIEIHGTFTQTTYQVIYQFQGDVIPPNSQELLPETKEYPAGAIVTREAEPTAEGYRFTGWYKNETFAMPSEAVVIYGEWAQVDGVFSPTITKAVVGDKAKYMQGDTVEFETTVTNTADYPINDVQLLEQLEGAMFMEGAGYIVKNEGYALIETIPAGESVTVQSAYYLAEDTEDTFTNTVALVGATAEGNYFLDTSKEYLATAEFETEYYREPLTPEEEEQKEREAENAATLDRIASYAIVGLTAMAGLTASIVMLRRALKNEQFKQLVKKHKDNKQAKAFIDKLLNPNKATKKHLIAFAVADVALVAGCIALAIHLMPKIQQKLDGSTINLMSSHASYEDNEGGAWKLTKTAKWTGDGEAEVTIDVDTIAKTSDTRNKDILYVVDVSGSMSGDRLDRAKQDMTELTESLLSQEGNRVAMVSFESEARKELDFTGDKEEALDTISNLNTSGCTNYYQALKNAGELLETYEHSDNTELILLFLTDGYPNEDTPNEQTEYAYLKDTYPYMTVNAIQYEMDKEVLDPIKSISDNQFIADMETLNNVLFDASIAPYTYSTFTVTDLLHNDYFTIDSVEDITASIGKVALQDNAEGVPEITWNMDGLIRSGSSQTLTIRIKIKDEYKRVGGEYPTNKGETVFSSIADGRDEHEESTDTPKLRNNYTVTYEANAPTDCTVEGMPTPASSEHFVFENVEFSENIPTCEGYNFHGYVFATTGAKRLNSDYFRMPESDVTIRATWTKVSIEKSMDGTVHEEVTATLDTGANVNVKMKKLSGQTGNVNYYTGNSTITGIEESYELPSDLDVTNSANIISSPGSSAPIYGWFENGAIKYYTTADKLYVNPDASNMFYGFQALTDIDDISKWKSDQTTKMNAMFYRAKSLTNVDAVSGWDTSNVTNMANLFDNYNEYSSPALTDISGLSNWDTSKVTDMHNMFNAQTVLSDISPLANWDTSSVTNMSYMFALMYSVTNVDPLLNWDTSSVTKMNNTFYQDKKLENINGLRNWDTGNVTTMQSMFSINNVLADISGARNWNVSKVTDMSSMFSHNNVLESLSGLERWDTSNVSSLNATFIFDRKLSDISALSSWNTGNVNDMTQTFSQNALSDLTPLANWNMSNVVRFTATFSSNRAIENIDALSGWVTQKTTNISGMISGTAIEDVGPLATWDVSNVKDVSYLFAECKNLNDLDGISNWNTENVTDMEGLFKGTRALTSIDSLADWNTSKVTNMKRLFVEYSAITNIDGARNWDTSKVTSMSSMFENAQKITNIDGAMTWDTSSVTDMSNMFHYTYLLSDIDGLSHWDTSKVANMYQMFAALYSKPTLTSVIDFSNWDTSSLENIGSIFSNQSRIDDLSPLESWDTEKITNKSNAFNGISESVARPTWY